MMQGRVALAAVSILIAPASASAQREPPHLAPGRCVRTTVAEVTSRLEGVPSSGSAIGYANRMYQVAYDVIPAITASRVGDRVRLCSLSAPKHCPPGDHRGYYYRAVNLRTGGSWAAPDSEHQCGGA